MIAGSDKRGTIYGLFELSKKIGVSPWHYMADVTPVHKEEIEIESSLHITSKEPSVKYRGFFINDEFYKNQEKKLIFSTKRRCKKSLFLHRRLPHPRSSILP